MNNTLPPKQKRQAGARDEPARARPRTDGGKQKKHAGEAGQPAAAAPGIAGFKDAAAFHAATMLSMLGK